MAEPTSTTTTAATTTTSSADGAADAAVVPTTTNVVDVDNGGFRIYTADDHKNLDCRFYENQFPDIESVVMVNVRNIADMGAYVTLLEYGDVEGMILLSELSRRRIRSIHKLIRVGRSEVVMVLRVDKDKGYIDLSKRRVSPDDVAACEDRFNKAKAVHGVLRHVAERRKYYLQDLYERIGWPLYRKYGHAYDAFKLAISDDNVNAAKAGGGGAAAAAAVDIFADIDVPQDLKDEINTYILRRLAPHPTKIRSDIEVSCFTAEGIDAIRAALFAGMAVADHHPAGGGGGETGGGGGEENNNVAAAAASAEQMKIRIKLIAPPIYVLSTVTLDKEAGVKLLETAIEAIRATITAKGGKMDVKMAPKAVSDKEENELQAMMDRLAMENQEVDGDAPDEE